MVVERDGVRLVRLTKDHIELVRQKRNSPEIQRTMEYRDHITEEMQQQWFASIDNMFNFYFLIEVKGRLIGLISATNIDWERGVINNGGVFIWDKQYEEAKEIIIASLLVTDLGVSIGVKENHVKILRDNKRSIAYNMAMGYELLPGQEDVINQHYVLSPERYFRMTSKLRNWLKTETDIVVTANEQENRDLELWKRKAYADAHPTDNIKLHLVISENPAEQ